MTQPILLSNFVQHSWNASYCFTPLMVTASADVDIFIGDPVSTTGIATDVATLQGFAAENVHLAAGEKGPVNTIVNMAAIVLIDEGFTEKVTAEMKAEAFKRGAKITFIGTPPKPDVPLTEGGDA